MSKDFLGRGWKFPVQVDAQGRIAMSEYEQNIREAIRVILLTAPGERVVWLDFGAGLHDYVFDTMSATTLGQIQAAVQNALIQWEPRIQVLGVSVAPDAVFALNEIGRLLINVDYRVRATNTRFNVVFPFYLAERS